MNGERYREVLNRINEDLNQLYTPNQKRLLWFQEDGATPRTAQATMVHLRTLRKQNLEFAGRAQMVSA